MTLVFGTPAPLFGAKSKVHPNFAFGSVAGRYILLAFLPPPGELRDAGLRLVRDNLGGFHDEEKLFFGVFPDAESFEAAPAAPPWRWFQDDQGKVRELYGAVDETGAVTPMWVVLDPSMRVLGTAPWVNGPGVLRQFMALGLPDDHAGVPLHAPVLIVPRVFEAEFCRRLIDYYEAHGGAPSGVMRLREGRTIGVLDDFKKRRDANIEDEEIRSQIRARLHQRLAPEIIKAFGWTPTKVERYIVARYAAEDGGYFLPHIDNKTPLTAHRRFAVSINLNAEEFEGGNLRFPEFGMRSYRAPTGGAVVFGCALLHEAMPVTKGVRFACLPFLYDDEGAKLREENLRIHHEEQAAQAAAAAEAAAAS